MVTIKNLHSVSVTVLHCTCSAPGYQPVRQRDGSSFLLLFWHAPLGVQSAELRRKSPDWTILIHVSCFKWERQVVGVKLIYRYLNTWTWDRGSSRSTSWMCPPQSQIVQYQSLKLPVISIFDEALIDCCYCSSCILPSWSLTGHWLYLF